MTRFVAWWDERQVPLYLAAIVVGAAAGSLAPAAAPVLDHLVTPVLALLLFATFLGVPLVAVWCALGALRFIATVLGANFLAVPALVYGVSRFVADDRGLLVGLLLVLLTPCIDYVIVFTGLAGGARARLLAAAPLLMLVQIGLLPLYLWLFAGSDTLSLIDIGPFVEAFGVLVVAPLLVAGGVQTLTGRHGGRRHRVGTLVQSTMAGAMVPLMITTLAVVVASQIAAVGSRVADLLVLTPIYVGFVVVALAIGIGAGRIAHLDVAATRAVAFSAVTRNSLVVLPLALTLPPELDLAPLAVVTQTLVELVAMVILIRVVPALVPAAGRALGPTT